MAKPKVSLFDDWETVDSDHEYVLRAMKRLELYGEFADLSCADQAAALALALCMKRAWAMHAIGQA